MRVALHLEGVWPSVDDDEHARDALAGTVLIFEGEAECDLSSPCLAALDLRVHKQEVRVVTLEVGGRRRVLARVGQVDL